MAFAVGDFHDLVRLLEEHPEWRTEMRRLVLSDELLTLPDEMRELRAVVQDLAEQVRALTEWVRALTERVDKLTERVDKLTERVDKLTERVEELAAAQVRTEQVVQELARLQSRDRDQLAEARGWALEHRYRDRAGGYFSRLLRRVYVLPSHELSDLVDDALDAGQISRAERDDLMNADLVVRGRRWEDGQEQYLVVEVSVGIDADDVERAVRRANSLARLRPAAPVVAGQRINVEGRGAAAARGAAIVLDGRPTSAAASASDE